MGKVLQVFFRKRDSPEHLDCFYLVDMLNLINDGIPLFILAVRKLRTNFILPDGLHSSLLMSFLELLPFHSKFVNAFSL